jgi:hypothetical protein
MKSSCTEIFYYRMSGQFLMPLVTIADRDQYKSLTHLNPTVALR